MRGKVGEPLTGGQFSKVGGGGTNQRTTLCINLYIRPRVRGRLEARDDVTHGATTELLISPLCEARRVSPALATTQNILTGGGSRGAGRPTLRGSPLWSLEAAYLRAAHHWIIPRRYTSRRNIRRASDDKGRLASTEFSRIKGGKRWVWIIELMTTPFICCMAPGVGHAWLMRRRGHFLSRR